MEQQIITATAIRLFFRQLGRIFAELIKSSESLPVKHMLFEHLPDGRSRVVGSFLDSRVEIPPAELEARAARVYDGGAQASYDARRAFLACDYINTREVDLPDRPVATRAGASPSMRRPRTFP